MGRTDVNLASKSRLMVKWYGNDRVERKGNLFDNIGTGAILPRLNSGAMADYVHTLSSTLVLNTRFGWTRFADLEHRQSTGFDIASIGFPSSLAAASLQPVLPQVNFGDSTTSLGPTGGNRAGAGFDEVFDSYQWFTTANLQKGRHALKFGADVRFLREVAMNFNNSAGIYTFGTQWTRGPLDNSAAAPQGQALASFLLGLPTAGGFDVETESDARSASSAFFVQDDWRATPQLTLNLGLRYELETGTTEKNNGIVVGFDPEAANRVTAAARAAYAASPHPDLPVSEFNPTGGLTFASPDRRRAYDTPRNQISPRIGVAYTPAKLHGGTVFRGGFGIYYHNYGITGINRPGFAQTTEFVPTNDGFLRPAATLSNPFPNGILPPAGGLGVDQNLGQAVTFYNPDTRPSYSRRYTVGLQQRLTGGMVLELSYQYNQARGLPINDNPNFVPARFLSTSPERDQAAINRLTANVANPFAGLLPGTTLYGSTVQLQQLLVPYPQFTSVTVQGANIGYSNQHVLSTTVQKRFSRGLQLLATYTRSSMKEATGRLNASDEDLYYGTANEDRPHRLVLSAVYALPFGAGRAIGAGASPWARAIIGGWTVSGHYTYQVGQIATWGNVIYLGGDLHWNPRNIDQAFDVTRFNLNAAQQLAMNIRTLPPDFADVRLDPINTLNAAVFKDISFGGQRALQLRAEAFNALDHVQFSGPQMNPTNANFGRVTAQPNTPRTFQFAVRFKW
jgi:outer membrane receptor protein involved in Fe transport